MDRRQFTTALASALAFAATWRKSQAETPVARTDIPTYTMLIHPDMVMQDLVGPMTAFNLTMGEIRLVWKDRSPIMTDIGLPVAATHDLGDCPDGADVLFVPGGLKGSIALMQDAEVLEFLRLKAEGARFVTSVCTGGLVLGAAGLLRGKHATTHWYVRDLLTKFGAIPSDERVVSDGNVITGGGVTAGLDFGLTLAAILKGDDWAKKMMLTLEYAPAPPFSGGTPATADPADVAAILARRKPLLDQVAQVASVARWDD